MENNYILKMGQVVSVTDPMDGGRIKVHISEDHNKTLDEIPYAFPLAPKMFQCTPKLGESVLVITSEMNNIRSQRYYLGPIVSQMQESGNAQYQRGNGASVSLLQGATVDPHKPLSDFSVSDGAFPDIDDVAVIGRKSEDIVLRNGEIDLRCGIRKQADGSEDKDLIGNVLFNGENPTYIQMKHKRGIANGEDGVINLVADKINIVSHVRDNGNNLDVELAHANSKQGLDKTDPLLHDDDVEKLMAELHQVPYGDVLVKILKKMCKAIVLHTHKTGALPATEGDVIKDVNNINFDELLSNHVRIS